MERTTVIHRRGVSQETKIQVRLSLGRWLALGLEFALAADILRTAVAQAGAISANSQQSPCFGQD
jgi:uncharacterized membrane protein